MKNEIKPCPYCGEQPKLPSFQEWPYINPVMLCTGCQAKGPVAPNGEAAMILWNNRIEDRNLKINEEGLRSCPHCAGICISSGDTGLSTTVEGEQIPMLYFSNCCDCSARGPHVNERNDAREAWNKRVEL